MAGMVASPAGYREICRAAADRLSACWCGRNPFCQDRRGVTALEFAVIGPVFMLAFLGILQFGLQLFEQLILDYQLNIVARNVQLGVSSSSSASIVAQLCQSPFLYNCTSQTVRATEWSGASFNNANLQTTPVSGTGTGVLGTSASLMVIDASYSQQYASAFQMSGLAQIGAASRVIFQNEPY